MPGFLCCRTCPSLSGRIQLRPSLCRQAAARAPLPALLARFRELQGGSIRIGNQSIREAGPERLLAEISMVFQDVYLFQDTIGSNIRTGNMKTSQAEIIEAAKRACCHEFISALPQGYDTPAGEGGSTLSGGEKQRVSTARALLKDASIVLLDEATASLDPENETAVQQAINELVANKTVILIAHRLKTICNADKILVLDQGRLVEWSCAWVPKEPMHSSCPIADCMRSCGIPSRGRMDGE